MKSAPRQNVVKIVTKNGQRNRVSEGGNKFSDANVLVKPTMPTNSCKRKSEISLDSQRGKKQKMDRNLLLQCGNILKELMNHPCGWIFSEPVDPVKLKIPDYFSIITKPMDLGTIKRKLGGNMYFGAEEFAADVRLTFTNAMLYNPPENEVHVLAKQLGGNFSRRWKLVEAKLDHTDKTVKQAGFVNIVDKNIQDNRKPKEKNPVDSKPTGHNKVPLRLKLCNSRPMSIEEKQNFRLELMQVLSRRMMKNLQTVFQKFNLTDLNQDRLYSFIDSAGDETLWKLRKEIKALLDDRDGKAGPTWKADSVCPTLRKTPQKELCNQSTSESSAKAKCTSCVSLPCLCQPLAQVSISASDLSSERSSEHDYCGDSKLDSEVKYPPTCLKSSACLDSNGPGVVLNEETCPRPSTPTSVEGRNSFGVDMSPKRALRAAMLKSRFADTIFRATHQDIGHGQKRESHMLQQEKARLKKEQLEEKARIEAAASRKREQDDLKIRREKERAAARMALQMMEKTVGVNENMDIWKEVETLCTPCNGGIVLEQLGLYMKDDDYCSEVEEDAIVNGLKGEVL